VLVSDFDYHLPPELIAQHPLPDRAASRMLYLNRGRGEIQDLHFRDLPALLHPGDVVVVNNTRVLPARLFGRRSGVRSQPVSRRNPAAKEFLRGEVEVLLTRQIDERTWQALVRPGRKIGPGEKLFLGEHSELEAEIIDRGKFGERTLKFAAVPDFSARLEKIGHVPLPPYISRADEPEDRARYQTVFAEQPGSVAAPTAGLHFTPEILGAIRERGIEIVAITLHVGLATFQPVHVDRVGEHKMHREAFSISEDAAQRINTALATGQRIVAVGTTSVRTLEYCAMESANEPTPHLSIRGRSGDADLFIYPGFKFRIVGALLTNFHLPKSTLLMLVSAFAGRERVLEAYKHAVEERYRFYSYGDCMFIE
jgi:S-adenosylmethionine:tRNA ribosyltransferase-isomerase